MQSFVTVQSPQKAVSRFRDSRTARDAPFLTSPCSRLGTGCSSNIAGKEDAPLAAEDYYATSKSNGAARGERGSSAST